MRKILATLAIVLVVLALAPLALVAFGAGARPPVMDSISAPFASVDYSDLPDRETFAARDGTGLAYRRYPADGARVVVALHGSSTDGRSLHPLARALAKKGFHVYVPDIRGHGASGKTGDVGYVGQLVDDIADLVAHVREVRPRAEISLLGFSSGGGLALKYAGSGVAEALQELVLVSPMLGVDAPPYTDENPHAREGEWARAFAPRIIGLSILNAVGVHAFDGLPVIAFAVDPDDENATARYSHRLLESMNPDDYRSLLEYAPCPVTLLAGARDEVFAAASYEPAIHDVRPEATVRLIEGVGHVGMTLEPEALDAIARSLAHPDE